jgi:jmjN domain
MDEFRDFEKYVKGVDPYGMQSGIVLIDPPEEWCVVLERPGSRPRRGPLYSCARD